MRPERKSINVHILVNKNLCKKQKRVSVYLKKEVYYHFDSNFAVKIAVLKPLETRDGLS